MKLVAAELTYINLTENNVYYAANHNQGIEHVPGVAEIALSEGRRVIRRENYFSSHTASTSIYNKQYSRGGKILCLSLIAIMTWLMMNRFMNFGGKENL